MRSYDLVRQRTDISLVQLAHKLYGSARCLLLRAVVLRSGECSSRQSVHDVALSLSFDDTTIVSHLRHWPLSCASTRSSFNAFAVIGTAVARVDLVQVARSPASTFRRLSLDTM